MRRRKRNPFIFLGIIVFCAFFAVNIISTLIRINNTKEINMQIAFNIKAQEEINQQLQDTIDSGVNNKDFIMDTARDKLGFGEKDEKLYINITGE